MRQLLCCVASIDTQVERLDHLAPFDNLGFDKDIEFLRCVAYSLRAHLTKTLVDLRLPAIGVGGRIISGPAVYSGLMPELCTTFA